MIDRDIDNEGKVEMKRLRDRGNVFKSHVPQPKRTSFSSLSLSLSLSLSPFFFFLDLWF